jgi:hypothetical protein
MRSLFSNPHVLELAERQSKIIEAFVPPSLSTPMLDHMRALLDVASSAKEPEVESLSAQLRNRLDGER